MTVRRRLILTGLILSLGPLALVLSFVLYGVHDQNRQQVTSYLQGIAAIQSAQIRTLLDSGEAILARIARNPDTALMLSEPSRRGWEELFKVYTDGPGLERGLSGFLIFNSFGNLVHELGFNPFENSVAAESFFYETQRLRASLSHMYKTGPGQGAIVQSYPVENKSGFFAGAVLAVYDLEDLQYLSKNIRFASTGYGYLVDGNGIILAHPDASRIGTMTENSALASALADLKRGRPEIATMIDYQYRGRNKIMLYRQIPRSTWVLAVVQDHEEALGPLALPVLGIGIVTSLGLSLIVVFIGGLIHRIALPVEFLNDALGEYNRTGVPELKLPLCKDRDLKELCNSFESMVLCHRGHIASLGLQLGSAEKIAHSINGVSRALGMVFWSWKPSTDSLELHGEVGLVFGTDWPGAKTMEDFIEGTLADQDREYFKAMLTSQIDLGGGTSTASLVIGKTGGAKIQCTMGLVKDSDGQVLALAGLMETYDPSL